MADSSTVLLVHGAWHGGWAWEDLVPHLAAAGLDARTVDLPSSGSAGPMADDAAVVRDALAADDRPTLVVGHSYGGIAISEGAAGAANVTGLVYLCAFMLDAGGSLWETIGGTPPPWALPDLEAGTSTVTDPVSAFYGDVEPATADRAIARLRPQSLQSFIDVQTQAAWKERPSTYVVCEQDGAIPPPAQEAMSAHADTVIRLDTSHSPMLSAPERVAELIAAAG